MRFVRTTPGLVVKSTAIVLLAATVACNDATEPRSLTVTVATQSVSAPAISTDSLGRQILTCHVTFVANLSGKGSATWAGATYRYYFGKDRTIPVDSQELAASEISESWGADSLTYGNAQATDWYFYGILPFTGDMDFHYRVGGVLKSATATFTCGPVPDSAAAAPTITALSVAPLASTLEAGTPLSVSFSATAPATLWQTQVIVFGPCSVVDRLSENLQTSANHTVQIELPRDCRLGTPLTVEVLATDAAGQSGSRDQTTQMSLIDDQPPTLQAVFPATRDYFGGDGISVSLGTFDNTVVSPVFWRVLPFGVTGAAESVNGVPPLFLDVPLDSTWDDSIQVMLWARDMAGNLSDTVASPPGSFRVHPTVLRPVRSVSTVADVRDVAIDSRRGVVYLREGNEWRIVALSMSTLKGLFSISTGAVPSDFDLTPSGDSLLVAVYGRASLAVIDVRTTPPTVSWMPITAADSASGQFPSTVRTAANGRIYVGLSGATSSARRLVDVNLATGAERIRSDAGAGGEIGSGQLERSSDANVLTLNVDYPKCLQRFDVRADTFSSCVLPYSPGWSVRIDSIGDRVATGFDVYDASMQLLPKAYAPLYDLAPTALSPDGQVLYVGIPNAVARVNAADSRVLDRMPIGFFPRILRVSADGQALIAVNTEAGTDRIAILDLR